MAADRNIAWEPDVLLIQAQRTMEPRPPAAGPRRRSHTPGPFIFIATNRLRDGRFDAEQRRVPGLSHFIEANEPRLMGQYHLACAEALAAGGPRPDRRPSCFFDPRHGMSVSDVDWTPADGGPGRSVPACSACAHKVEQLARSIQTVSAASRLAARSGAT